MTHQDISFVMGFFSALFLVIMVWGGILLYRISERPGMVFHLTHNYGHDPWCGAHQVLYKCGINSIIGGKDEWCPSCKKICLEIHKRELRTSRFRRTKLIYPTD